MAKKSSKQKHFKLLLYLLLILIILVFLFNITNFIKKTADTFMVENGTLSYEESTEGYIIRDESILKGNNYSNGLSQIVRECTRVSKDEPVFRYYSNKEESLTKQIEELDKKIDEALEAANTKTRFPNDIINLEKEIKLLLDEMYESNDMVEIIEYKKRINAHIVKKAEIAGELSPAGSYIKSLVEERTTLSNQLTADSEIIKAPNAGLISYRVDGLEEVFIYNNEDFGYINSELLDGLELNTGVSIPESKEAGKIVDNYQCYIACPMDTKYSDVAKVGQKVALKLFDGSIVNAEICQINEEENCRIIIFKIVNNVEGLLEFRKISLDVIWWSCSGWKISNKALIEKDDLTYIKRTRAGIEEEILVKVLRQNDTYSIVENYEDDELIDLGFTTAEIQSIKKIKLFDEIMLKK